SCAQAADSIKEAYEKYFFDEKDSTFINSIYCDPHHTKSRIDKLSDASIHALWMYGMFDIDDKRIKSTIEKIEADLWLKTEVGGIARKMEDHYMLIDKSLPGNPWFISALWMVQYYLKTGDKSKATRYLDWVIDHSDHTGLMAEQAHPHTGFGLSMKPLTWSHSEFVRTINMI
ncbi:MAG TPA: hypothetical protein PLS49_07505, partial [Candidatus Woesebacteria bacterium]|nr:hypothetical protein [Candidatus Woesebacteria bacterium]